MKFTSINEITQFSFEDCQMSEFKINETSILAVLEALIVKPNNSQNQNFTESYADTANLLFSEAKLISAFEDGYNYYDANDNLLESIPDRELSEKNLYELMPIFQTAFLYEITKEEANYKLCIELPKEEEFDTTPTKTYTLLISSSQVTISWDRYLNRVQH